MREIYEAILDLIGKGERAVLATVVSAEGSAPRNAGAKMLVRQDGSIIGTIGGGGTEQRVRDRAVALMAGGEAEIASFDMSGIKDKSMICGGQVSVFLEPIVPPETMFIVGAGHIGQSLAVIGKRAGFRVVMIDPRPEFNCRERFPAADKLVLADYGAGFGEVTVSKDDYIVILTPGHFFDEAGLEQAIKTPAKYIGMIGSKKKVHDINGRLVKKGVSPEVLEKVHAPIGLEIGAETPEEIAISIMAEIIKVRRGA